MANCDSPNDDKIKELTTRLDSIERLNKRNDDARYLSKVLNPIPFNESTCFYKKNQSIYFDMVIKVQ